MKKYCKSLFLILPLISASIVFADVRAVTPDQWGGKKIGVQMKRHNLFKKKIAAGAGERQRLLHQPQQRCHLY